MEHLGFKEVFDGNFLSHWKRVSSSTKPVIAAVNGIAVSLLIFSEIQLQSAHT